MKKMENLWPKDLGNVSITMPKEVLIQQSNFLAEMTKNIVVGEVNTSQGVLQGTNESVMVHHFIVKAPSLGNYQFTLLRVMHNFSIYPVTVWNGLTEIKLTALTEEEFIKIISDIFNSTEARNAINSMVAQSI